jgi:hypothetical protein
MPLLAIIEESAFNTLADETVLGKDSFIKDEKTNTYRLAMDGAEAGKLAIPLQQELKKLSDNNAKLLDEKIKKAAEVEKYTKLGKTPEEIEEILKSGRTPAVEELEKTHNAKLESVKQEHSRLLEAAKAEAEAEKAAKAETEKHLISTIKRTKIAELKNEHDLNGVADHVLGSFITVVYDEDLGKYAERVVENGEIAYKGTAFKTPEQLVEDLKANKEYAGMFNAGTAAGGGTPSRQSETLKGSGVVNANDPNALAVNIEGLATGKVKAV